MSDETRIQLNRSMARLNDARARTALADQEILGYDNTAMNDLGRHVREFQNAYVKDSRGVAKREKHGAKEALVRLVQDLDTSAPRELIGKLAPEGKELPQLQRHLDALAGLRHAGEEITETGAERTARMAPLRENGDATVAALAQDIHHLRDSLQARHTRTRNLSDLRQDAYIPFAKSFVAAAIEDTNKGRLQDMQHIQRVARQTSCFLSMIEYVDEVEAITAQMREHPRALWDEHAQDPYAQQLLEASQKFHKNSFKNSPVTADTVRDFRIQDEIIRRGDNAHSVKVASEHLKHLALDFLMGGPATLREKLVMSTDNKKVQVPPKDHPKLLSRISLAYRKDYEPIYTAQKQLEKDRRRGTVSEEGYDPLDPFKTHSKTLDHVFAARWAIAADEVEHIVRRKHGMLADPDIETFEKPSGHVGEVQRRGLIHPSQRRRNRTKTEGEQGDAPVTPIKRILLKDDEPGKDSPQR